MREMTTSTASRLAPLVVVAAAPLVGRGWEGDLRPLRNVSVAVIAAAAAAEWAACLLPDTAWVATVAPAGLMPEAAVVSDVAARWRSLLRRRPVWEAAVPPAALCLLHGG